MSKILIIGPTGQVGFELMRALAPLGDLIGAGRGILDLADGGGMRRALREIGPDLIVNAAAYTDVEKAESEPELAMRINGVAPGILAEEAKRMGAPLVHYSSDYVFDGRKRVPGRAENSGDALIEACAVYAEEDAPNPLSAYGRSKLAGDRAIEQAGVPHLILRTSWVYSNRGRNFLLTMLRLGKERKTVDVVADQIGAPTWSRSIAQATAEILTHCRGAGGGFGRLAELGGMYHVTAAGRASWYDFACEIFRIEAPVGVALRAISAADYPAKAVRPVNSVLDNSRVQRVFGCRMDSWQLQLELCMREI